jgi:hypothetical protein
MKSPRDYFKNFGIDPISKSCTADETCSNLWTKLSAEFSIEAFGDNFVQSSDYNPILASDTDISDPYIIPFGESAIVVDSPSVDNNLLECPAPITITTEQCNLSGDVATTITDLSKSESLSDLRGCNNLDTEVDPTDAQQPTGTSQIILVREVEQSQVANAYADYAESTCSNECEVKSCIPVNIGIIKSAFKTRYFYPTKRTCSSVARRNYLLACEFMKLNTSP